MGFEAFKKFLIQKGTVENKVQNLDVKKLYKFARNGLFHSLVMYDDFLIDCINFTLKPISENLIHGGWLINPWLLIENLNDYVDFYAHQLKTNKKMEASFKKTFTRLILEPMGKIAKL